MTSQYQFVGVVQLWYLVLYITVVGSRMACQQKDTSPVSFQVEYAVSISSWIQCGVVITRSISPKYSRKTLHRSPVRARYGVSFVGSASDWYSAAVHAMVCAISCYIRPLYRQSTVCMLSMISRVIIDQDPCHQSISVNHLINVIM